MINRYIDIHLDRYINVININMDRIDVCISVSEVLYIYSAMSSTCSSTTKNLYIYMYSVDYIYI